MYQHHIMLKTAEPLDTQDVLTWLDTVREFAPTGVVFSYSMGDKEVAMEYGTREDDEFSHCYIVPLYRDITPSEAEIVVGAWEYIFPGDFDVEISNQYSTLSDYEIDIDSNVAESAIMDMNKWHHNRWLHEMLKDGWRLGTYYSSSNKTHPALKDWDHLSETHKRSPQFSNKEIVEWINRNKIF